MKSKKTRGGGESRVEISDELLAEAKELKPPEEERNFGKGQWYWPKSWECQNPNSPLASLSVPQEALLDRMTGIVSVKRNWMICTSLPYLVRAFHGKRSRRSIWEDLQALQAQGFAQNIPTGKKRVALVFLVNSMMMGKERAAKLKNFDLSASMRIQLAPAKAPRKQRRAPQMINGYPKSVWERMPEPQRVKIVKRIVNDIAAKAKAGAAAEEQKQLTLQ